MFRPSKSGRQLLEPRLSDLSEQAEGAAVEWEREPILNLVAAVLGAGVLGFPFCFKTCGMALAVALVLVTLAAAELGMRLLLMASQVTGRRSYEELARHAYGRAGQAAVDLCVLAMNLGSVVAYLNILTDTISSVAGTVIPPGAEPSRSMMLFVVTMAGCLPVALFVKSAQLLNAVNSVSMVFLLSFCCIIALLPFSPTPNTGTLTWWRWEGVLVAFPIVSYGFTAHQYLFQMYPSGQRPSMRKMTAAVQRGLLLSAAIYMVVGACGYTAFGTRTAGDVLRNFGGVGASGVRLTAERVLKYAFGVSLLGTIPLTVIPLHTTCGPWLALCSPDVQAAKKAAEAGGAGGAPVPLSQVQESLLTTAILVTSYALAALLPNVEFVFGLAGSTASTLMAFILPPSIFLSVTSGQRGMMGHSVDMMRSSSMWRQRRRMAGVLLAFGCLAGVLCTRALLLSIQEEHEVVQLAQELVREEAKAAVAVHAEQKAKQVAEAVETVVRAAQEVDAAQAEATNQTESLTRAAQELNNTGAGVSNRKKRQEQKAAASSELERAHSGVGKAVEKLENVTASLGATASRLRNETASGKAAAAGGALAHDAGQQQQGGEQRAGGEQSASTGSSGSSDSGTDAAGGSAALLANQAQQAAVNSSSSSSNSSSSSQISASTDASQRGGSQAEGEGGGDDEVAEALEKVASSANETLAAVKQSQVALEAAATEAATSGKTRAKAVQLGKAISDALNATAQAAASLNATSQALKAVEQEKTSELVSIVTQLARGEEEEDRAEVAKAAYQHHTMGRKEGLGFTAATAADGASQGASAATATAGAATAAAAGAPPGPPGNTTSRLRQELRDVLKQVAATASGAGNGTVVNVTQMAQAAIDAASNVVASSKASVEQAIEKKKAKVATRAIEIAKELHNTGKGAGSGQSAKNGTGEGGSGTSMIEAAELKHEEMMTKQSKQDNVTRSMASTGSTVDNSPPAAPGINVAGKQDHNN